jgi:hypothetical protein
VDLEYFGRSHRLRWLWHQWTSPDKPWCGSEPPTDAVDEALFVAATRVTVHNGSKALFWQSSWLNGCAPAMICPTLYNHSRRKNRTVANTLANDNWIQDLMYDLSPEMFADYLQLWLLVDGTTFNANDQVEDTIVWTRTVNERYSAKSAYNNSMEVVSPRSPLISVKPGHHHAAKSSSGSCCREGSGLAIVFS